VAIYRSDYTEAKGYYPTLVASYEYDPWGKVTSVKGSSGAILSLEAYPNHIAHVNPIRYRGYYYDNETGFYYLQSRYYDPIISRFINADSYGSTGQAFLGTNMFAYCNNNPVNSADPTGTISIVPNKRLDMADTGVVTGGGGGGGLIALGILALADAISAGAAKVATAAVVTTTAIAPISVLFASVFSDADANVKTETETKDKTEDEPTWIYRYGGTNPGNLTPRQRDVDMFPITGKGLSFSTIPKPGAAMTTIEALNATGVVYAVRDGTNHVSVYPVGGTLLDWYNAGSLSVWTVAVKSVVVKWDGGN
jgi:RHS repeat-associated protein